VPSPDAGLANVGSGENVWVTDVPDRLALERNRDLDGLRTYPWPRWLVLGAIALMSLLGLANVFGQRPVTFTASAPPAQLELYAPEHLRGGLLFSARFHVTAHRALKDAFLVLDPGWLEGMAVNTIEPSPVSEGSANGRLTLELGHVRKGASYVLYMQFQVNPTNVAWRRSAGVVLTDGAQPILRIDHHYTIYP
jgi:hypothetical protein